MKNVNNLSKKLNQNSVQLVSILNRVTDRAQAGMRPSPGDIGAANRLMDWMRADLAELTSEES